jgi:hypothetical protein
MDYFLAHLEDIALRKISLLDLGHNGTEGRQIGELLLVKLQLVKNIFGKWANLFLPFVIFVFLVEF